MRVLVVDDEQEVLRMMCKIIQGAGHEVYTASNGREALACLHRVTPVDVLVTDIIMPEKEGVETIQEVRRSFPEIKILAVSGGGSSDPCAYLTVAKAVGAAGTLRKPFGQADLLSALHEVSMTSESHTP